MLEKKIVKFFFIILLIFILSIFIYSKFFKKSKIKEINNQITTSEDTSYSSNIIEDVYYSSKDAEGNEYIIQAKKGEIDFSNSNIIYLTDVSALIKLSSSEKITIISEYGKYNSDNFNTIFSKNVIINYLDNQIISEYLDLSLQRSSMIISKKVIYKNLENILSADVIEIDLKTKDTKIFMYESEEKVNIKSK